MILGLWKVSLNLERIQTQEQPAATNHNVYIREQGQDPRLGNLKAGSSQPNSGNPFEDSKWENGSTFYSSKQGSKPH